MCVTGKPPSIILCCHNIVHSDVVAICAPTLITILFDAIILMDHILMYFVTEQEEKIDTNVENKGPDQFFLHKNNSTRRVL